MPRKSRAIDPSPEQIKKRALKIKKRNLIKMKESDRGANNKHVPTVYYLKLDPADNYYLQSKPR